MDEELEELPYKKRKSKFNSVHDTDAQDNLKSIRKGIANCLATPDGVMFFQHLMSRCGFHRPSVTANPNTGEMFIQSTMFFEGQRAIWLELRHLIPREYLVHIENPELPVLEPVTKAHEESAFKEE